MRRFLCLSVLLAAATAAAAPVPKVPHDPTKDREGNPLPKGATARLGSLAFRAPVMYGLTFSRDGKQLLSVSNGQVFAWDADTGRPLPTKTFDLPADEQIGWNGAVAGDWAVWLGQPFGGADRGGACTAVVYDFARGRELSRFKFPGASPHFEVVAHRTWRASVTPDGKYLASVTDEDKGVAAYDLDTGKQLFRHDVKDGYGAGVYLSPDATTLYLCAGGGPVRRFELKTGKELAAVAGTDKQVDTLQASADGRRLVTRGAAEVKDAQGKVIGHRAAAELVVRDVVANKTLGTLEVGATAVDFRFAGPDALIVLAAKYRPPLPPAYTFSRWDLATLRREWEVAAPAFPEAHALLAASPDGKRFAATDRTAVAHVYHAATGKPVVEPAAHFGPVAWVGFSPDGERVLTAGPDGVRTWTPAGERKGVASPAEWVRGDVRPALFGEHLVWVTRSDDGKRAELVGWDRAKGAVGWRTAVDGAVPERVLTHDGQRCVGVSYNRADRGWDVAVYDGPAGKKLHGWSLKRDQNGGMYWWPPLALSPDGTVLLVGGDGIAGLDVTTGKEKFNVDAGPIRSDHGPAAFPMTVSADGTRVAVAGRGEGARATTLRVFGVKSGKKLAEHDLGKVHLPALRFSPDGKQVAVWNMWSPVVQMCDAASDRAEPRKLDGGTYRATAAAFNLDGTKLVVGYQDGTALVWDLAAK